MKSIGRQTTAEKRAMIEECAERGRRLLKYQFSVATVVDLFSGLKPAQRAGIMKHYKADGTIRW